MAPKNQPSKKTLNAWVRFGLRHNFDADMLDPVNGPALARDVQLLRAQFINWAEDPEGLEKSFNETVAELREEFVRANPRLRIRYATKIKPIDTEH